MDIEAGNKLIAEFMGFEIKPYTMKEDPFTHYPEFVWNNVEGAIFEPKFLTYHSSWDWLMPVVEKIETGLGGKVWVSINGNTCGLWNYFDIGEVLRGKKKEECFKVKNVAKTKIEATWLTVIEFIKWYNTNPNQ